MPDSLRLLFCVILALAAAAQTPTINNGAVLNAASYAADIARGSIFTVFGSDLGPSPIVQASGLPLPTELAGTRVTFTPAAGGAAIEARIVFTLASQVAGLLPSSASAGDYDVRVIYTGRGSAPQRIKVVERNFGFVTVNSAGTGPAQATFGAFSLVRFTTGSVVAGGNIWDYRPAKPGDTVVLWGTGLGPDVPSDTTGQSSGDVREAAQVRVLIAGREIQALYAGRSLGLPGTDQINFTLPADLGAGCGVAIQVRAGGRLSNAGSLAVVPAGRFTCEHPVLGEALLRRLDAGGTVTFGSLNLSTALVSIPVPLIGSADIRANSFSGAFSRYGPEAVIEADRVVSNMGQCFVTRQRAGVNELTDVRFIVRRGLDAGPQLTVNGPNVNNRPAGRNPDTLTYALDLGMSSSVPFFPGAGGTSQITAGRYTVRGPGGPGIAAFEAALEVPAPLNWTNRTQTILIDRLVPLIVNWTGGTAGDYVTIGGASGACIQNCGIDRITEAVIDATVFTCTVEATRNTFSVPVSVLTQLPPSTGDILNGSVGFVVLALSTGEGKGRFNATLTAGGDVDHAVLAASSVSAKSVPVR